MDFQLKSRMKNTFKKETSRYFGWVNVNDWCQSGPPMSALKRQAAFSKALDERFALATSEHVAELDRTPARLHVQQIDELERYLMQTKAITCRLFFDRLAFLFECQTKLIVIHVWNWQHDFIRGFKNPLAVDRISTD